MDITNTATEDIEKTDWRGLHRERVTREMVESACARENLPSVWPFESPRIFKDEAGIWNASFKHVDSDFEQTLSFMFFNTPKGLESHVRMLPSLPGVRKLCLEAASPGRG